MYRTPCSVTRRAMFGRGLCNVVRVPTDNGHAECVQLRAWSVRHVLAPAAMSEQLTAEPGGTM